MNITVYLGAKEGNDPALKRAVQELGQWIGQSGNALVYGGSKTGLMGEIAKSVLDAGGTVTGVETTLFMQDDLQYDGLTELIVTETITERKTEMIRRGDAFIAFPGGTGTLEEIAEKLGYKNHSGVLKRIRKIGQAYEAYTGVDYGFERGKIIG